MREIRLTEIPKAGLYSPGDLPKPCSYEIVERDEEVMRGRIGWGERIWLDALVERDRAYAHRLGAITNVQDTWVPPRPCRSLHARFIDWWCSHASDFSRGH